MTALISRVVSREVKVIGGVKELYPVCEKLNQYILTLNACTLRSRMYGKGTHVFNISRVSARTRCVRLCPCCSLLLRARPFTWGRFSLPSRFRFVAEGVIEVAPAEKIVVPLTEDMALPGLPVIAVYGVCRGAVDDARFLIAPIS